MVLTREADYAVRIMERLCRDHTQRVAACTLAQSAGVTQRFTLKILHKLVEAGLAVSFKGPHGGYQPARPPEEITLLQVLEAVEGPYMLSRCQKEDYTCDYCGDGCRFQRIYNEVTALVREKLGGYTFADLCRQAET